MSDDAADTAGPEPAPAPDAGSATAGSAAGGSAAGGSAAADARGAQGTNGSTGSDGGDGADDTDRLTVRPWQLLGEARSVEFAELLEPPCVDLLVRVDETAGPNYQPASRIR